MMNKIILKTLLICILAVSSIMAQETDEQKKMQEFMNTLTDSQKEQLQILQTAGVAEGKWKEGLMMDGIGPSQDMFSTMQFYPRTELVRPDEMRITFMGSSPLIREDQSGMSIYVELGNGDNFIFDIGAGSMHNYLAMGVPMHKINNIFLTHLHADHIGDLPYVFAFRAFSGGYSPMEIYGPNGRTEKFGTKSMVEGMQQFLQWNTNNFEIFPTGEGYNPSVHEFDYKDEGGVIYDQNGVKIIHWSAIHVSDGASSYRLDWNGLSMVFTGDGRPNKLTVKYAKGCDIFISEIFTEILGIQAQAIGVSPAITRFTYDNYHTSAYGFGYMAELIQPRIAVGTHWEYDAQQIFELTAEVRTHWKGPFALGAPDRVVFNIRPDKIWWRDGVTSKLAQAPRPQLTPMFTIPPPKHTIEDIQEQWIRDLEIDPKDYYPEGYHPELLKEWPMTEEITIPIPERMQDPMNKRKGNKKDDN